MAHVLHGLPPKADYAVNNNAALSEAQQHSGQHGDSDMFSSALGFISKFGKDDQDIDEHKVMQQHEKVYQQGQGSQMDASSIGSYVFALFPPILTPLCLPHAHWRRGEVPPSAVDVQWKRALLIYQCCRPPSDEELHVRRRPAAAAAGDQRS